MKHIDHSPLALLLIPILIAAFAYSPAQAQGMTFLLIGASNALNGDYAAARAFEARMFELTGEQTTVIVCAQNGSGLQHWQPGTVNYNNCLAQVTTVSGVIFINGEYEGKYGTPWTQPFLNLVTGLRADLGDVPIVFTRLHPKMPGRYVVRVRGEQASTGLPFISTDDLRLPFRSWHYQTAELVTIGRRLAETMYTLGSP